MRCVNLGAAVNRRMRPPFDLANIVSVLCSKNSVLLIIITVCSCLPKSMLQLPIQSD